MYFKMFVRNVYESWNYLKSESVMMLSVTLICWAYRYILYLIMVHPIHQATVLWMSYLTGSNEALCIHPHALELFIKAKIRDPCSSCWMVMYIDVAEVRNSSKFNIRTACNYGEI